MHTQTANLPNVQIRPSAAAGGSADVTVHAAAKTPLSAGQRFHALLAAAASKLPQATEGAQAAGLPPRRAPLPAATPLQAGAPTPEAKPKATPIATPAPAVTRAGPDAAITAAANVAIVAKPAAPAPPTAAPEARHQTAKANAATAQAPAGLATAAIALATPQVAVAPPAAPAVGTPPATGENGPAEAEPAGALAPPSATRDQAPPRDAVPPQTALNANRTAGTPAKDPAPSDPAAWEQAPNDQGAATPADVAQAAVPAPAPGTALTDGLAVLAAPSQAPAANAATTVATPATATTAQATATPHTPAAQLAQAAAGIHIAPGAAGQVTIHLQPAELGAVQVRIERARDGTATVTVQVERAETLHALQQDMPHFHAAMDAAGLPTAQRAVTLHLATSSGSDTGGAGNFADSQRQPPRQGRPQPPVPAAEADDAPRWQAAGVNITA
jgi:hypothetical protein